MTARRTTTTVPYTADQMFDLVVDVEKYPDFLPWCAALRVVSRTSHETGGSLTADMVVAYSVFRERFRSQAVFDRVAKTIDVEYLDGPFSKLTNCWRFTDKPEGGSIIDFAIEFEFRNLLLQTTAKAVFEKAFVRMSEAFVARADDVYGN